MGAKLVEQFRTVKNGDIISNLPRPKIDLEGELNAQSGAEDREDVFEREKQDSAYIAMANAGTYEISKEILNKTYPASMGYDSGVRAGSNFYLNALLKPRSDEYSNGNYYFYSVLKVDMKYQPLYGEFIVAPKIMN